MFCSPVGSRLKPELELGYLVLDCPPYENELGLGFPHLVLPYVWGYVSSCDNVCVCFFWLNFVM
jgi:hypothetical protein